MTHPPVTPAPGGADGEVHYFFIKRPVLAIVISVIITLMGVFAIRLLPISRYPQITPPAVQVQAVFPGATAEDVAEAVAAPIEAQLSGLQGLLYYSSANASDGTMSLQIYFDVNRSQDLAAVDVQNAVKLAEPQLPDAVRQNGITILKANTDILGVVALTSDDPRYDAAFLTNYMKLYVEDEIKRTPGIGNALTFGGLEFSMLIQLDPDRMAQLGITTGDVAAAVREQNATSPAGRLGREPAPEGTELTLPVTTLGRLKTPEQFADIVVRAKEDGSIVRIRDIGKVVLGSRNYDLAGRLNGTPVAPMLLYLRPGANALAAKEAVVKRMGELSHSFPRGVHYKIPFDTTPFVTASIHEVVETLLIAMALVTLVVFIFLQSWRATLIPMLAVPVSVVGTFLGLLVLGFTINVLTLFALVLAIGIVVDDAIVVIENTERIMARGLCSGSPGGRPGDPPGRRRAGRDRAGALCRLRSGRVPRRGYRLDVQAVRGHPGDRGAALRSGGADAHTCALRHAAQGLQRGQHQRLLRPVQSEVPQPHRPLRQRRGPGAGPSADMAGGVRSDGGAGDHPLEAGAHRIHPHRG